MANKSFPLFSLGSLILSMLLSFGCQDQSASIQSERVQMELDLAKKMESLKSIENRLSQIDLVEKGDFLHEVYFNFKNDISAEERTTFMRIINELKTIDEAKGTQIGIPKATGDKRIRTDYDLVLHMSFNNMEDYKTYQHHATHLSVKKRIRKMLAGPPFVYDYEIK